MMLVLVGLILITSLLYGQPSFRGQKAIQIISQQFGLPITELAVAHEVTLEEEQITRIKVLHVPSAQVYVINLDWQDQEVDDLIMERILAQRRGRGFEGKLERDLANEVGMGNPADPIKIAAWLKQRPNQLRLDREATSSLRQAQLEAIKNYYADLPRPLEQFVTHNQGKVLYGSQFAPLVFVEVPKKFVAQLEQNADVETLYLSRVHWQQLDKSTRAVNADNFWNAGITGGTIKAAVVEYDGIAFGHPNLKDGIYCNPDNPNVADHATMVAGVIGSTHSTYKGVAYGGPALLSGNYINLADPDGIACTEWAINQGAKVINYSFANGSNGQMNSMDRYADHVVRHHAVTVAVAAGNCYSSNSNVTSPALGFNVLAVGAFDDKDTATGSDPKWGDDIMMALQYGHPYDSCWEDPASPNGDRQKPELAAPGVKITSTNASNSFWEGTGTSAAAPHVAGAAALLMAKKSALTSWPEEVRAVLMASAVHNLEGSTRLSEKDGAGGIDLASALRILNNSWSDHGSFAKTAFPKSISFSAAIGERIRFAIAWDSAPDASHPPTTDPLQADFDLHVRFAATGLLVGVSASFDNAYEIVDFQAPASGTYTATISYRRFDGTTEYLGWARLHTTGIPSSSAEPLGATRLSIHQIRLSPHPIRGSQATFVIEGEGIEQVGLEVFDLSGRKVFDRSFQVGKQLTWNLLNDRGERLANGIYLYIVKVKGFQDEVAHSEVRKLVILR